MSSSERVPEVSIADGDQPKTDASLDHLKLPKKHFQRVVPGELPPISSDVADRVLDCFNIGEQSKRFVALKTGDREVMENPIYTAQQAAVKAFAPFVLGAPNFARSLASVVETQFTIQTDNLAASLGAMGVLMAFDLADDSDGKQDSFIKKLNRLPEVEWADILTNRIKNIRAYAVRGALLRRLEGLEFPVEQANLHRITYKLFFVSPSQEVTFDAALATFNAINSNWGNLNKNTCKSRAS